MTTLNQLPYKLASCGMRDIKSSIEKNQYKKPSRNQLTRTDSRTINETRIYQKACSTIMPDLHSEHLLGLLFISHVL